MAKGVVSLVSHLSHLSRYGEVGQRGKANISKNSFYLKKLNISSAISNIDNY